MKTSINLMFVALVLAILLSGNLWAAEGIPTMTVVTPETAKPGDIVAVEGANLSKANVTDLFLTDGSKDWKCEIVEQGDAALKFKVPVKADKGRLSLMILLKSTPPRLLELPAKLTVE